MEALRRLLVCSDAFSFLLRSKDPGKTGAMSVKQFQDCLLEINPQLGRENADQKLADRHVDVLCNVATGVVPSRVMYEDFINLHLVAEAKRQAEIAEQIRKRVQTLQQRQPQSLERNQSHSETLAMEILNPQGTKRRLELAEADLREEISKRARTLAQELGLTPPSARSQMEDQDLTAKFVAKLRLDPQLSRFASQAAENAYKISNVSKYRQSSIIACCILIVAWLTSKEARPTFQDVAKAVHAKQEHVQAAYRSLYPFIRNIIGDIPDFKAKFPLEHLPRPE